CLFALDLEATKVATHTGLRRNTVSRSIMAIRQRIVRTCQQEMEVEESYFGLCWVKGQRGQGTRIKTNALGIFERNGKVYTEVVPDEEKLTSHAILRGNVGIDVIIRLDRCREYDGRVVVGIHINENESFLGTAKTLLAQ